MQRIGHQLLAGAGFAGDQHRQRRLCQATNGTEQRAHRWGIAHQLRWLVTRGFGSGRGRCHGRCHRRQHALRQRHRIVQGDWLGQEFMRATAERAGGAGHIGVGRHHHHRQLRQCGLELVQQHQAVVTRHAHVGEQQGRRRPLAQRLQRRRGTVEINDLVARFAQRGAQHEAHGAVIVDHPDALCGSGEQQGEHGMARARAVGQRAAMLARHLLGQRQAQASAFGAATDQRQEQVFGQFLRHAPAVVGDLQAQRQRVQLLGDAHAMLHAGAQGSTPPG
ncbi:hypothetical protein G6F57_017186 [Rhizopus arrhizus]|nr:hypothetical protein G6F57_017186 [Rhizopus arrhizus]